MKNFIGTKQVKAKPMTLGDYNKYRMWDMPSNEDPNTEGYLVEYLNGGKSNHNDHEGYISWSPKDVFEESYSASGNWTFGDAMLMLENGHRVCRKGWNGKGMFIFKVDGSTFKVNREPLLSILGEGTIVDYHSHIDMKTANGQIVPWICSQTDMAAKDWQLA